MDRCVGWPSNPLAGVLGLLSRLAVPLDRRDDTRQQNESKWAVKSESFGMVNAMLELAKSISPNLRFRRGLGCGPSFARRRERSRRFEDRKVLQMSGPSIEY